MQQCTGGGFFLRLSCPGLKRGDDKCLVSRDRARLALRYVSLLSRSCQYERGPTKIRSTHSVNRVKEAVEYPPVDVVYIPVFLFQGRTCIALCSSSWTSFTANFVRCCVQSSFVLDRGKSKHHLVPKTITLVRVIIPSRAERVKALSNAMSPGLDSTRPSQTCHYSLPPSHFLFCARFFFFRPPRRTVRCCWRSISNINLRRLFGILEADSPTDSSADSPAHKNAFAVRRGVRSAP